MTTVGSISKARAWAITTVACVALVVALAVGLGYTLYTNNNNSDQCDCPGDSPEPTSGIPSPLFVPPSSSKKGTYRFAGVAADNAECSKIGKYVKYIIGQLFLVLIYMYLFCFCFYWVFSLADNFRVNMATSSFTGGVRPHTNEYRNIRIYG